MAGSILFRTVRLLSADIGGAVVAVTLFSFSRPQWMYAITGEVFALNNLLVAMTIHATVCYAKR